MGFLSRFVGNTVGVLLWMLVVVGIATLLIAVGVNRPVAVLIGMACWYFLQKALKENAQKRASAGGNREPGNPSKGSIYTESELAELKRRGL